MDLLLALDTIRNASDHSLHSHATQTILTLRRVGQRLQHNLFAETPSFQASPSELTSVPSPPQSPRPLQSAVSHQKTLGDPNVTSPQFSRSSQIAGSPDYQTTAIRHPPGGPSPKSRQPSLLEFPTQSPDTCPLLPGGDSSLSIVSPALLNAPTPPDHVPDLLKRVKQSAEWAWEVCQKGTSHILPRKRNCDEDPRLEHIRRVEGDRFLGNEDKLLRILALRSIALEFTNKQIDDKVSPTKLEEICEHSLLRKPAQKIFKYDSKDFSSKALSAGLKHLVLEKIIADRLGRCDLPNMCNAISAIVGLHIDQFRRLRYNEMTNFADKLLSEDMHVTILQSKVHLLDLVRDLSPYFIELQNFYDVIYKNSGSMSSPQNYPRLSPCHDPVIIRNYGECPVEAPEIPVSQTSEFEDAAYPENINESRNFNESTQVEFADIFYEQISTQPIDVSGFLNDIATRSCFDFEYISAQQNFGL